MGDYLIGTGRISRRGNCHRQIDDDIGAIGNGAVIGNGAQVIAPVTAAKAEKGFGGPLGGLDLRSAGHLHICKVNATTPGPLWTAFWSSAHLATRARQ